MLLRQPSPLVDLQGVCISYQETYLFSGMWCRALEFASDNKKWYFCQSLCLVFGFFLVCCDSAKKLRSIKSAGIQVLGVSCGLGNWSFSCCRRASVDSCFGCAQLCLSLWCLLWKQINLNWSCKVLAGHPHKTPQKGFLPYLQLKESAQIRQHSSYPGAPRKKHTQTSPVGSDSSMDP